MLTPDDLARRKTCLGGSEVAKVAGLSPYGNALDVYLDKTTDDIEKKDYSSADNEPMYWGNMLEDDVIERFVRDHNCKLVDSSWTSMPGEPWCGGTVDAIVEFPNGERYILEAKTTDGRNASDWDNGPPVYYRAQVSWYSMIYGLPAFIAVLIGGNTYKEYYLPRDLKFEQVLFRIGKAFWKNNVERRIEPNTPISGASAANKLGELYSVQKTDVLVDGGIEAAILAAELDAIAKERTKLSKRTAEIDAEFRRIARHAAGVGGEWGKYTFTEQKSEAKQTDWKSLALYKGATPEEIERFTSKRPKKRRKNFQFSGD